MTCKEMERLLAGLIDGDLSDEERGMAEDHLRSCGSCRGAFADLKKSGEALKRLEEVEPPPWLKARVMARVREGAGRKEGILRKLFCPLNVKVPIQALATVLIAVVAWNVYRTGETEFRQAAPPAARVQEAPTAAAPATAPNAAIREVKPEAREKKVLAQPPAAREDRGERKAEHARRAEKADAAVTVGPLEAPGSAQVKGGEVSKAARATVGTAEKEAEDRAAAPAAAPRLSAAVSARADLAIILRVLDQDSAAADAEALLRDLGAQSIERKDREGLVTLTARILPEHLEAFREKLRSLGAVREQGPAAPRPGIPLAIRLEIRPE